MLKTRTFEDDAFKYMKLALESCPEKLLYNEITIVKFPHTQDVYELSIIGDNKKAVIILNLWDFGYLGDIDYKAYLALQTKKLVFNYINAGK